MLDHDHPATKILFIESDEASFQIRQCVAQALTGLPPVELYHARDATEALSIMERLSPHVVVINEEEHGEKELFIDSLSADHPPILLQTLQTEEKDGSLDKEITYIQRCDSLEGIHQTLMTATSLADRFAGQRLAQRLH